MTFENRIKDIDNLKPKIDSMRPIDNVTISSLKEYYKIGLTYSSNAIEGNTLTETETKVIIEDGITIGGKTLREHYEAIGHAEAYDFIYSIINQKDIDTESILKIHKLFYYRMDENNAGKYRTQKVVITGTDYTPPAPKDVPKLMNNFIENINNKKNILHPVELSAMIHTDFVNIHPFIDGNGRTARLLMNLNLIKNGYPITIIPPILRTEYINAVRKANYNENSDFLNLISNMVYESMKDYLRLIK